MARHLAITFIRHGVTRWNLEKRYLGWTDQSLDEEGRAEINRWISPPAELVFTSDLQRAVETATLLYPDHHLDTISDFRELHFGDWEGKRYEELQDQEAYRKWLDNHEEVMPPNGESLSTFVQRIEKGWKTVLDLAFMKKVTSISVIAHGGTIRQILTKYSSTLFWEWQIVQGIGIEIILESEKEGELRCISLQEVPLMANGNGH